MLPGKLKLKACDLAKRLGISLSQLIRDCLAERIEKSANEGRDPFFADEEVYEVPNPAASAENIDVIYGEPP
ncbi:MAG: hypothetical protein ACE15C_19500 [Phycisphaerae bacterium]